jgi:radical SAM protein (TIGR01212 family)
VGPAIPPPVHPALRYHNYAAFLRRVLGAPAARVCVDGGFSCPNRDGTVGTGGCSYCDNESFTQGIRFPGLPVEEQVRRSLVAADPRGRRRYLVYFQKFTGTHGLPAVLRERYRAALAHPLVAGLVVGTRPDCLGEEVLDLLAEIARERYLCVELGLQSMSDDVLRGVNRGHTVGAFAEGARSLARRGIDVGAHLICGLPGDTRESFLAAAPFLSGLGVRGVKLHHFHVVKGAPFEAAWRRGEVAIPRYDGYVEACADFLERLSPDVAVMRMAGEAPDSRLLAPRWGKGAREAARDVSALLAARGTYQGLRWGVSCERREPRVGS